jgi:hypothetical protein
MILFICVSCNNENNQIEQNKYQILNLIYSDFSKQQMEFFVFPERSLPLPKGVDYTKLLNNKAYSDSLHKIVYSSIISKEDSLKKINNYIHEKENQQIFAFDLTMKRYHNLKNKIKPIINNDFKNLYNEFIDFNRIDTLNINKIKSKNNDSIIQLKRENLDFKNNNIIISFSNIVFNSNFSKSIIIATKSWSALDSYSLIYFLEKRNNIWVVTLEKTL